MAKFDRKKFRHDISVLKKQGLIGGADFRVDSAEPWMIRGGKALREYIKKYDDILSGKATAVKLPPKETSKYRSLGYEIAKPKKTGTSAKKENIKSERVIIPHAATEKVKVRGSRVDITHPAGITRSQIPVEYSRFDPKALKTYLKDAKLSKPTKHGKRYYAFNFFGNQSSHIYESFEHLIEDLERYDSIKFSINSGSAKDMAEIFRNLEIVTVDSMRQWKAAAPPKAHKKQDSRKVYRRRMRNLAQAPEWKQDEFYKRRAAQAKKDRENMTPAEKEKYKAAARERAKKSANRRKK